MSSSIKSPVAWALLERGVLRTIITVAEHLWTRTAALPDKAEDPARTATEVENALARVDPNLFRTARLNLGQDRRSGA